MMRVTRAAEERERLILIGTWLIGLGAVFLVKEALRWEWSQAWPLFVILVGVGGTATAWLSRHRTRIGAWGIWWPLAILVVGVALLLITSGTIGLGLGDVVRWWPLVAIGVGAWFVLGALLVRDNRVLPETLEIPIAGLSEAEVRLSFGGGELRLGPAAPGVLVSGRFEGGVIQRELGPGRLELKPIEPQAAFWEGRAMHWDVALTAEIPVDLRIESGANRSRVDLATLRIRRLEVKTGASDTHLRLPGAGMTSVKVEAGLASLNIEVPSGVAARIRSRMGLGSTNVDESRFPRSAGGWTSPDFETAADRVEIEIEGGLGSVRVA